MVEIANHLSAGEFMHWVEAGKNELTEETLADEPIIINNILDPPMPTDEVSLTKKFTRTYRTWILKVTSRCRTR